MYYDFGLKNAILSLFKDKEFRENRGRQRHDALRDIHSLFGCREGKRLIQVTNAQFVNPRNSPYDLTMDFGQWYRFCQRSFGVVSIRCPDLPADMIGKSRFTRLVVIVPGPTEPKCISVYIQRLVDAILEFMPQGAEGGIPIRIPGKQEFLHGIYLARIYADTPTRQKLSNALGHSAYLGCLWCMHSARRVYKLQLLQGKIEDATTGSTGGGA